MSKVTFIKGNIFETQMDAMVCPVNAFGVMGAGLAKMFRDVYNNDVYISACQRGEVAPGTVLVRQPFHAYKDTTKALIYAATKLDYRDDSKMEWIELCLLNISRAMKYYNINSIAIPALGCGFGKLPWATVQLLMKSYFESDGQTKEIEIYEPLSI